MKIKVTTKGKVHDVGYRLFLLSTAERFGIKKFFAENVKIDGRQAVLCYVEGSDEQINEFKDFISKESPENATVESINFEDYDGFVMDIDNYYRFFSSNQLYKIATYGAKMLEKQDLVLEKQDLMIEKQDTMLGKMDLMIEKQDTMLGKMDLMLERQDVMIEKQDATLSKMDLMLERQDETIKVIREESEKTRQTAREESEKTREEIGAKIDSAKEEIGGRLDLLRLDLREYMELNFKRLSEEMNEMKKEFERLKEALRRAGISV